MTLLLIFAFLILAAIRAYANDDYDGFDSFEELRTNYLPKHPSIDFDRSGDIVLYSPKEYQVFQRQSKYEGIIVISGKINVPFDRVQYRITGIGINGKAYSKSRKSIRTEKTHGYFTETIKGYAGGWYTLELWAMKGRTAAASVKLKHIGIGEIFVGAGQSNSTNSGDIPIQQESGMVVTTDGINWRYGDDPMIGSSDRTTGGSYYPAFGDLIYREFGVPVAFASTGHGGTAIEQWQKGNPAGLYNHFITRVHQLGRNGFRAVLWHQGENDAEKPTEVSVLKMTGLIRDSNTDAGWRFPWFVAKVSCDFPGSPERPLIRNTHQKLWDTGIAMEGPDTDILPPDMKDSGVHFNPKGLRFHAELWAEKLIPYIHSCID